MAAVTKVKKTAPMTAGSASSLSVAQRVAGYNRWRDNFNPLRRLTMSRAVTLAEDYFRGYMADLQWSYFFIEQTDADLLALLELRFGRLLEMEVNIKVAKDADKAQGEAQAAYLRERFDAIDNLYEAIEHLGMASFRGYAHCEKWYGADGELNHLEVVDQWNAVRDGLAGAWKYNPEAQSTSFTALPDANLMPPEQFLFRQVRRPINRIAFFKFVRMNLSEKDWDAFVEIYGIPGGVLIGPPNVATEKEAEFETAAKAIAEGGSGYVPNGSDWKPNTAARGTQPFKERLDHLSEKLVLAGTGGKLTMLTDPTGLGSGASDKHGEVFDTIACAEARRIAEIFNKQLVTGWLAEKFPSQKPLAYFELAANQETDTTAVINEIKVLSDAGYRVAIEEVSERTGYTVELKPAVAAPTPFANRIRNRIAPGAAGRSVIFRAEALKKLTAAQAEALKPLTDRLAEISGIEDEATQDAALVKLHADLPKLFRQISQDPVLVTAFEEILGTALVSGAATAAQNKTQP